MHRISGCFIAALLMSAPVLAQDGHMQHGAGGDSGSMQLHQKMMEGSKKMASMKMSGDLDHDFLMTMRQHHLDAIDMGKIAVASAKDPKVKEFAQKTMDMQKKDLVEIDAMLSAHGKSKGKAPAGMK